MAETVPAAIDPAGGAGKDPRPMPETACWELDPSGLGPLMDGAAAGKAHSADWVEAVLAGARVVDVSQEIVHRVGAHSRRDEMLGNPAGAFWPSESRADLAELILELSADPSPDASRTRRISSLLLLDPELTVRRTVAHGPGRVLVEVTGIPQDNRSRWALRASEERYRKLIHHLPFPLVQVDAREVGSTFDRLRAEGVSDLDAYLDFHPELIAFAEQSVRITEANHGAVLLMGAGSGPDLIGPVAPLFAASPGTARRVMVAHFDGLRSHAETMKLRTLDRRLLDVRLSVTYPTPPEQRDVTLICLEDLTDRIRTEAQLRHLQADFARAARISTLGELATSIAHEVNQPLAAILTNAETVLRWLSRDDPSLDKIGQLAARIAASAERASEIVQRIRGMAAKPSPQCSPLDLNDMVQEVLLFLRHDLETRSIKLSVELAAGLPAVIGDRVQLQQVIVNLMVNSLQAIAQAGIAEGAITLNTGIGEDGRVTLRIGDNGPGIAGEHLDRIFEGFFTTKAEGIGIGLAICQSIVAAHNGEIAASNAPGGGACFRLGLPAQPVGENPSAPLVATVTSGREAPGHPGTAPSPLADAKT